MTNPISSIMETTQEFCLQDKASTNELSRNTYKSLTVFNESINDSIKNVKVGIDKKIIEFSFNHHRKSINQVYGTLGEVRVDISKTAKFFRNTEVANFRPDYNVYDLDWEVVEAVRPKFLSEFATTCRSIVLHGDKINNPNYIVGSLDKVEIMKALPKVKANCVKIQKGIDITRLSELFGEYQPQTEVDAKYMKRIADYLDGLSNNNDDRKMVDESLRAISEAELVVEDLLEIIVQKDIAPEKRKIAYSAIMAISEVASYLVYAVITRIASISSKICCINRVRDNLIEKIQASGTIIEESGNLGVISSTDTEKLADDLKNGHVDCYTELSRNLYEFHKSVIEHALNDNTPGEINRAEYSHKAYEEAAKIYIMIANGLNIISKKSDEYIDVFDHLIEEAGFQLRLEDKYRGLLETLDDITEYESSSSIAGEGTMNLPLYTSLVSELYDYPDNMQNIADTAFDVYQSLKGLKKRFSDNINGEYRRTEAINQLNIFFEDLEDQYRKITNIIASKFLARLTSMGYCAESFSNVLGENGITVPTTDKPEDFRSTIFESEMEQLDIFDTSLSRYMQESYILERIRRERGCDQLILEAEQPASGSTAAGTAPSNNTNSTGSSGTPNTSAKVIDNSADANAAQKVASKSSKFSQDMVTKICDTIKRWFDNTRASFKNIMDRKFLKEGFVTGPDGKKLTYTNFLKTYKEYLLGKNYTNTEIHILPYTRIDEIYKGIEALKTNISALQKDGIKNIKSEQEMYQKLFTFVPGIKAGDVKAMQTQITNYMTTGKEKPEDRVYKNNEVGNWVKQTIPFLEQFMGQHMNRLNQELTNLETTLTNTTKTYTESFAELFTEIDSLYMEDDTQNANQNQNVSGQQQHTQSVTNTSAQANNNEDAVGIQAKSGWMRTAVMYFTGTIFNIIRDRVQNSFKILAGFSDKANKAIAQKNKEEQEGTNTNQNTTDNTNNNPEASGNN